MLQLLFIFQTKNYVRAMAYITFFHIVIIMSTFPKFSKIKWSHVNFVWNTGAKMNYILWEKTVLRNRLYDDYVSL